MEYARKCSVTGEGMNNGWINEQTYEYFKYKKDVINYIKSIMKKDPMITYGGKRSDDDILEVGYNYYDVYYTEWEYSEDMQYIEINGVLTEI